MKPRRLRERLFLLAIVPPALLVVAHGVWWGVAGGAPGAAGHAVLLAVALAGAATLVRWQERLLGDQCEWLVDHVRRIREGRSGRLAGRRGAPVVERLAREIDALADEIEHIQHNLHERIGDATRELQDTQVELEARHNELDAARSEAEAASGFKSRFLANISHEIRTPMNSILGFTELIDDSALDRVQRDHLAAIRSSAHGLLSLLNGILELSKIESGRMEFEYRDTDVNELLYETYHLFAPQAFGKGIELHLAPAAATRARVRTDPTRLKQVLVNLASNAVKFTDAGHVCLGVDAEPHADGSIALTFSFSDTGRGIPPEAQSRLFQALAQGEQAGVDLRCRPVGTGLGLHIASEIVFLMDGLIEFRSEPGAGSAFWLHLRAPSAHRPAASPVPAGSPRRALLVAEDAIAASCGSRLLRAAGIELEACSDVEAALVALEDDNPRAVEAVLVHVPAREASAQHGVRAPDGRLGAAGVPVLAYTHAQGIGRRRALIAAGYTDVLDRIPEPDGLRGAFVRAVDGAGAEAARPREESRPPFADADVAFHVLVVDDQPVNLKLMEGYLAGTSYVATAVQGSNEALYQARLHRFHAILLDIHLPERDGIETTRLLRAPDTLNADTPIIGITADAFAEPARMALSAGMNDVLVKPVGRRELLQRLAEWGHCADAPAEPSETDPVSAVADAGQAQLVYDPDDGVRRAGGHEAIADELFGMLLHHLPASREELEAAAAGADWQRVAAAAHRLKGAAAYCGVPCLRRDLDHLERAIDDGSGPGAALERVLASMDAVARLGTRPAGPVAESDGSC